MLCRQHLPVERCAELLSDVLGVSVSTGWLSGLVAEAGGALVPFVDHVTDLLRTSPVIGVDETGARVRVAKRWFHVLSTPGLTLLSCQPGRGREAIEEIGMLPAYRGVIVHDGLALYDGLGQASHAQCNAHLLRHLAAVGVVWDQQAWTKAMTEVLIEAKVAADDARERGLQQVAPATVKAIEARYDEAIAKALAGLPPGCPPRRRGRGGWREHQRQAWNLAHRMTRNEADVLRFLIDTRIPFTNNGSERDLRMVKLLVYRPSGLGLRLALEGSTTGRLRSRILDSKEASRWASRLCTKAMGYRLGGDGPITEVGNRFLGHLGSRGFSPATVRGYAQYP